MRGKQLLIVLMATMLWAFAANCAYAQSDFYKDKTLTFIVPYGPGGGYDTWARMAAPFMQKYLQLGDVKIVNKPGGGALIGTNAIYNAKPDGLTIGDSTAAGDLINQAMGAPGIDFDVSKFSWIGRPDRPAECLVVRPDSDYTSFNDFLKLKDSGDTLKLLTPGHGSSAYNAAVMTLNALDIPNNAVSPFKGTHAASASFVSGVGDTLVLPLVDARNLGGSVKVVALLSNEKFPGVDAPTLTEIGKKGQVDEDTRALLEMVANVNDLGHAWLAPPGVPQDRLDALREAFRKTIHNPAFVKKAEKAGFMVKYASGEDLQSIVEQGLANKQAFARLLSADK